MEGIRRVLANSLQHKGFERVVAPIHGSDAWRLLQSQPFEVVISDWNMPVMSGLDLLKKIRTPPQDNLPHQAELLQAIDFQESKQLR
jgi:CheY-like chemotaxis protein